jgi:hypothetical protein
MKKLVLIISAVLLLIVSCKKDEEITPGNNEITAIQARDLLYTIMNANYLWYDHMPPVKKEDYEGPAELMNAMIYKPIDKWSM